MSNIGEQAFITQINRIEKNVADAYTQASLKGAILPAAQNSDNLPNTIASITGGGESGTSDFNIMKACSLMNLVNGSGKVQSDEQINAELDLFHSLADKVLGT